MTLVGPRLGSAYFEELGFPSIVASVGRAVNQPEIGALCCLLYTFVAHVTTFYTSGKRLALFEGLITARFLGGNAYPLFFN